MQTFAYQISNLKAHASQTHQHNHTATTITNINSIQALTNYKQTNQPKPHEPYISSVNTHTLILH